MSSNMVRLITFLLFAWFATTAYGQDALQENRIKSLKRLEEVRVVFRRNIKQEVLNLRELNDLMTVGLKQKISRLRINRDAQSWLELSYIMSKQGGLIEIVLHRWVTIVETGQTIFAGVWNDKRVILGGLTREAFKENLDTLLTSFAADYTRANP